MNPVQRFFRRYIFSTIGILTLFFVVNLLLVLTVLTAGYMSGTDNGLSVREVSGHVTQQGGTWTADDTALALLQSPDGDALLREARELAAAAAARDRYACMRVLAGVERDKSRATRLIELLRSLCGAWMRSPAPEDPLPSARAAHAARQAGRALTALESNANPRLTLTALALRLCRV